MKKNILLNFTSLSILSILFLFQPYISQAQDDCTCTEYIYLNETDGGGKIHKYAVNADGTLTEIFNGGNAWYPGANSSEMVQPHGLVMDLNGFIYSAERFQTGIIRQLNCAGEITPLTEFELDLPGRAFNFQTIGNTLFTQEGVSFDLCSGEQLGSIDFCASAGSGNWGFVYDENTGYFYAPYSDGTPGILYRWTIDDYGSGSCVAPFIDEATIEANVPNVDFDVDRDRIRGVTVDPAGNIYITIWNYDSDQTTTLSGYIVKFDPAGNFVSLTEDIAEDGTGFFFPAGMVYSETSGFIYSSTQSRVDDCLAYFDTDLNYLGAAVSAVGDTGQGQDEFLIAKAVSITTECCPTPAVQDISNIACISPGQPVFLNEEYVCEGVVCEGTPWEVVSETGGVVYDACDQSVQFPSDGSCITVSKVSDGSGETNQCGAFNITYELCAEIVTPPAISITDNVCTPASDGTINVDTDCPTGTLEFSVDGGTTWSATVPTYDTSNAITVRARCISTGGCIAETADVTTAPQECCPPVNCVDDLGSFTIIKNTP